MRIGGVVNRDRVGALTIVIALGMICSVPSVAQHLLFHLLGQGATTVSFSSPSQTVSEVNGLRGAGWAAGYTSWAKRIPILLNHQSYVGALTDFPLMVRLNASRINYSDVKAAGADIRFADSAGNPLSFEIERWDTGGDSILWVKVPSIAALSSPTIYLYYGNSAASDGQSVAAVWSNSFKGVYHFNSCGTDSLGLHAGTCNSASLATGKIGSGVSLSGAGGSNVNIPKHADFDFGTGDFTLSVWVKPTPSVFPIKTALIDNTDGTTGIRLLVSDSGTDRIKFIRGAAFTDGVQSNSSSFDASPQMWSHVLVRIVSNVAYFYINGVAVGSGAVISNATSPNAIKIGEKGYAGSSVVNLNGLVDEVQISQGGYSDTWAKVTYQSQVDGYLSIFAPEVLANSQVTVQAQLTSAVNTAVAVPYVVSGTATNPLNHDLSDGSISIPSGSLVSSAVFNFFKDYSVDTNQTVVLTMGSPSGGVSKGPVDVHTVTVTADVNTAPVATNDSQFVSTLVPQVINVLSNDIDANADPLTITAVTQGAQGSVTIAGPSVIYRPTSAGAPDSFTYTISDGRGGTSVGTVSVTFSVPFTWTGAVSSNWSTGGNWIGGVAPGPSDIAIFNDQCTANCNVTVNAAVSVAGISVATTYTGTITQTTFAMTIGSQGWVQRGGAFVGGSAGISFSGSGVNSRLRLEGGSFTSTSGTLDLYVSPLEITSGSFVHNSGTVKLGGSYIAHVTYSTGAVTFYNLYFNSVYENFTLGGATWTVNGTLTINDSDGNGMRLNSGTVRALGDVVLLGTGIRGGSGKILVAGTAPQTINGTGTANGAISSLEIDSTSTVTVTGTLWLGFGGTFRVTNGTVAASTATLGFMGDYSANNNYYFSSLSVGSATFAGEYNAHRFNGGVLTVLTNLTLSSSGGNSSTLYDGTILAYGNLSATGRGLWTNNAKIRLVGTSGTQTVTGTVTIGGASPWIPHIEINPSGASIAFSGSLYFAGNYTYQSGVVAVGATPVTFHAGYATATVRPGPVAYADVTLQTDCGVFSLGGDTLTVTGGLTLKNLGCSEGDLANGTVEVSGGVTTLGGGISGGGKVKLVGSTGTQFVSGTGFSRLPSFEVATSGANLTLSGNINFRTKFKYISAAASSATGSTMRFEFWPASTLESGAVQFEKVEITGEDVNFNSQDLTVLDSLYLERAGGPGALNNGTIHVGGTLNVGLYGRNGNASLEFIGSSQQSVDASAATAANFPTGTVTINNASGVKLLSNTSWNATGQTLTCSTGCLDMNAKSLTVKGLSLNSKVLTKNSGVLTVNGTVIGTGALFGGTIDP